MKDKRFRRKIRLNYPEIYEFMDASNDNQIEMLNVVKFIMKDRHNIDIDSGLYDFTERNQYIRRYTWDLIENDMEYLRFRLLL